MIAKGSAGPEQPPEAPSAAELARERAMLDQAERAAGMGSWRMEVPSGRLEWSAGMYRLYGIDPDAFSGDVADVIRNAVHPDDRAEVDAVNQASLLDGIPRTMEYRVIRPDGTIRWVHAEGTRVLDAGGDVVALVGFVRDITESRLTEAALRASEARFATAFRTSPDSVNINRLSDGLFLEINAGFTALTGYTEEDVAGRTSLELDVWADPADRDRLVAGLRRDGFVSNLEALFRSKDGSVRTGLMSARVLELDGELCIMSVTRDISERRAAELAVERSEARYRMLFDSMLEGLAYCRMIYDDAGKPVDWEYLQVNEMFTPLTGLRDVVGKRVSEIIPDLFETNPTIFQVYGRVATTGVPERTEAEIPQLGLFLDLSVYGPEPGHFIAVFEDVSARKRREAEVRALNEHLEARVVARTEELEAANEELAAINEELRAANEALGALNQELAAANAELDIATRAKDEFLASMSHELRTPLNSILGFSSVLLAELAGPLTDEQRRQLAMVNNSGQYLLDLINSVLDLARIDAGQVNVALEAVDVCALARGTVDSMVPLASAKGLALHLECGKKAGTIVSDRTRLTQILLNLLGNAVKFTDSGSVTLRVKRHVHAMVFTVIDTGRGVAPEEAERIFEDFYQGAPPDGGKTAGTGLGLAVSRKLAEALGASITVESTPGKGSRFALSVPILAS